MKRTFSANSPRTSKNLALRQARLVLVAGFVIGLALALVQLSFELRSERRRIAEETALVSRMVEGPAAQANYILDVNQAREIIESLLRHPIINSATIINEHGRVVAEDSIPSSAHFPLWLLNLTFGPDRTVKTPLTYGPNNTLVGRLDFVVDSCRLLKDFLLYSGKLLVVELLRTVFLAAVLGLLFALAFTRTISRIAQQVAAMDPLDQHGHSIDIPKAHMDDELGLMLKKVNALFASLNLILQRRDNLEQDLRQLNQELEQRIDERTSELQAQALALKKEIEERKAVEDSLAEQHGFLNTIFKEIGAAIFVFDPEQGRMIDANEVALDMLGLTMEDIEHESCVKDGVPFSAQSGNYNIFCPDAESASVFEEGVLTLLNGERIPLSRYLVEVYLFGHPHLVQIFFNIAEQKKLERQLSIAQRLESIGLLAAGVAHEINTPIQYVGDSVQFIKDAFEDVEKVLTGCDELRRVSLEGGDARPLLSTLDDTSEEADLDFIRQELPKACDRALEGVQRVSKIVLAMKNFSHVGTEQMKAVDINSALETTIAVARNEWKYVAEIETDFDSELPLVYCMPGDINQVFLNIVINAAHAMKDKVEQSGQLGTIYISTHRERDNVLVSIKDSGCGIPPENMAKIFDPFFTTKEVGKGTGQGLAIAHDIIVNKHHGSITLESEVGSGATFHVRLPLEQHNRKDEA